MGTTQLFTNRDIWSEILRYFAINLVVDDKEGIQLKRQTILAIALTHPDLVDVTLDELWKSMVYLEPIVHVINGVSESTPVLKYNQNMGIWEISPSSNSTNFCSRARSYLSRIRDLHLAGFPSQGNFTLLSAISTLIQSSPICPNLQKIFLGPGLETPAMIYNIIPLVSPTLQSITLANTLSSRCTDAAIPSLLNVFKCYGVQLREISYCGPISPLIVQTISEFSTLRSVSIQPSEPPPGDIRSFHGMGNLTRLDVHLGIFRKSTSVGDFLKHMPSLATLRLSGSWQAICACFRGRTYESLQSLSLFIDTNPPKDLLATKADQNSGISVACPRIRSFTLVFGGEKLSQVDDFLIIFSDLLILAERPLEVLELRNFPEPLPIIDVIDILGTWPLLKRLCIVPPVAHPFECEASRVLSHISDKNSKLQCLDIPLDFSTFVRTPISSPPPQFVCPLQELYLSRAKNLPQNLHDKLAFCRKITSLLPRLTVVTSSGSNSGVVKDLQAVINLVQDVSSSPPKRQDHLFF